MSRRFNIKPKVQRWLYSVPAIVLLLIAVGLLTNASWGMYQRSEATEANLSLATEQLEDLQERRSFVQTEVEKLETEEGLEANIREKFNVAKEGEHVIVIVDEDEDEDDAATTTKATWTESAGNFFKRLLGF